MKYSFIKNSFIALSLVSALCISCKQDEETPVDGGVILDQALIDAQTISEGTDQLALDSGIASCTIPEWTKSSKGYSNLPAVITDGSASNVTKELKAGVCELPSKTDVANLIVMFFDGLTEDLVNSSEVKYGELILNDLPFKTSFKASSIDSNTDKSNIIGLYLTGECYKKVSYVTTGCIVNDAFRQFKGFQKSNSPETYKLEDMFVANPRPLFILGHDIASGAADDIESGAYLNEFYKSCYKYISTFQDALACYKNNQIVFRAADEEQHKEKKSSAKGVYAICDPAIVDYPSAVQSLKYSLSLSETMATADGFAVAFYDDSKGEDKEAALKNFDEAVAVACKYVLENPETLLVVTSAALDGSTIPAYILGNISEEAKEKTTLLDFIKASVFELEIDE